MNHMEQARRLRPMIVKAAQSLDDREASAAPEMFGRMKYSGALIKAGTRINWHDAIKRAAADLWDTEENNPDNASALWTDIAYREGVRIIPQSIMAAEAFARDECGWWGGALYVSLIDANVHTPQAYPAGWMMLAD